MPDCLSGDGGSTPPRVVLYKDSLRGSWVRNRLHGEDTAAVTRLVEAKVGRSHFFIQKQCGCGVNGLAYESSKLGARVQIPSSTLI